MELKDFIQEALTQIIDGIKAVQSGESLDAVVNPNDLRYEEKVGLVTMIKDNQRVVQSVDFEVALTSTELSGGKTGIGVFFPNIGIGGQKSGETGSTATTSIKFSILVAFPSELSGRPETQVGACFLPH